MKLSTLFLHLTALASLASTAPNLEARGGHKKCCLCEKDAQSILKRYVDFFEITDPKKIPAAADALFTDDFSNYDETLTDHTIPQGENFIASKGKDNFVKEYAPTVVPVSVSGPKIHVIQTFWSCNGISFRWEADQTVIGDNFYGLWPINHTIAPIGFKFQYKGIDMLEIDCPSKKVKNDWGSHDALGWFATLGVINFVPTVDTGNNELPG